MSALYRIQTSLQPFTQDHNSIICLASPLLARLNRSSFKAVLKKLSSIDILRFGLPQALGNKPAPTPFRRRQRFLVNLGPV